MLEPLDSMEMQVTQVKLASRDRRESSERRATEEQREPLDTRECREPRATGDQWVLMALLVQLVTL